LKGKLEKDSVKNDFKDHAITFRIRDNNNEEATIVYTGPPQDMSEATDVVAIGTMQGDQFHSEKLLIKCPSKYEGGNKAKV